MELEVWRAVCLAAVSSLPLLAALQEEILQNELQDSMLSQVLQELGRGAGLVSGSGVVGLAAGVELLVGASRAKCQAIAEESDGLAQSSPLPRRGLTHYLIHGVNVYHGGVYIVTKQKRQSKPWTRAQKLHRGAGIEHLPGCRARAEEVESRVDVEHLSGSRGTADEIDRCQRVDLELSRRSWARTRALSWPCRCRCHRDCGGSGR